MRNEKLPATQQSQIENLKSKTASRFHGQPSQNLFLSNLKSQRVSLAANHASKTCSFKLLELQRCSLIGGNRNSELKIANSGRNFFYRTQASPVLHHRIVVGIINAAENIGIDNWFAGAIFSFPSNQKAVSFHRTAAGDCSFSHLGRTFAIRKVGKFNLRQSPSRWSEYQTKNSDQASSKKKADSSKFHKWQRKYILILSLARIGPQIPTYRNCENYSYFFQKWH